MLLRDCSRFLSVLSRIPAVSAEIFDLAEALADRYASTVANVLRLAVTPRVASLDKQYAQFLPTFSELMGLPQGSDETADGLKIAFLNRSPKMA